MDEWKEYGFLALPKWLRCVGFEKGYDIRCYEKPESIKDNWVYGVEFISYTVYWLGIKLYCKRLKK
jgi:hypothetical protein